MARYFEGLRRTDAAAVRAALAPDYNFDRSDQPLFDPENPFGSPLSLIYRSLSYRIAALTTVGSTATALVTTVFDGDLQLQQLSLLQAFGIGQTPVIGTSDLALELEPRGGEWKLTAVRPVRASYRNPGVSLPQPLVDGIILGFTTLSDYTVDGQPSLTVAPGAPLDQRGRTNAAAFVLGVIGSAVITNPQQFTSLSGGLNEPWEVRTQAPVAAGRYLAYAIAATVAPDASGQLAFGGGDADTIPVTVAGPP